MVKHDHHLPRTERRAHRELGVLEERACEGRDQEGEGQGSDEEQDPVMDLPSLDRAVGDLPEEHERGELDHVATLSLGEMHQDGDRQPGQADKEEGRKPSHQRTLLSFSRLDR